MIKKLICLILTVSFLLSMTFAISVSAQELTRADVAEQINFIQKLGIINSVSEEAEVEIAEAEQEEEKRNDQEMRIRAILEEFLA